jgi:WhiB family redox-sensing transcriptional regulator
MNGREQMPKSEMSQIPKATQLGTSVPDIKGAPCQSTDPDTFFPDTTDYAQIAIAKSFCNQCEVSTKNECLSFALDNGIHYGVWGGKTSEERKLIRRRMTRRK